MDERWWTWNWDDAVMHDIAVKYVTFTRYRRGWVTLYVKKSLWSTEYQLYLPFNVSVGICFNK